MVYRGGGGGGGGGGHSNFHRCCGPLQKKYGVELNPATSVLITNIGWNNRCNLPGITLVSSQDLTHAYTEKVWNSHLSRPGVIARIDGECSVQLYSSENINATVNHTMKTVLLANLKREQREAIQQFLSRKDVFVSPADGYGKTYCYALLPLVFNFLREREHPCLCVASHSTDLS